MIIYIGMTSPKVTIVRVVSGVTVAVAVGFTKNFANVNMSSITPIRLVKGCLKHVYSLVYCTRELIAPKKFYQMTCGLYYKTIMIVIMMIVSDATIWSVTYNHN